ncbi:MAG TPA: adenosine kinase [Acidiphilium sp.]|jgi:fructokinase|uniref:adenosine kinase n=1 Tax=unclassified Acidiphilium TaxID=2617493 RepID=UPI000BDD690D|nr:MULTISPECIES: adenosine kinase [unclassified Acidiphilium]OYV54989.1 MAG: adenosine kinase [Acidiphilium sp. 20-67-58]HQT62286.1 adenosine kinase [Acidiphilium sp.]HQT74508.1 adenosine kinase [Acidiphilium sp.]HQU10939.1 adenosine kinase [Acidiphilium sp.]
MDATRYDIIGIGNAIVDVLARTDDHFLDRHDMRKGAMRLIDAEAAERILGVMPPGQIASGGSVANSCAVAAGLGARAAFLGKVARDELGIAFANDLRAIGVDFPHAPLPEGAPTARCLILVTPDGQRTMNTYLGACIDFDHTDLDAEAIQSASILYLEGYLFDPPRAQHAFREAVRIARGAGRKVALSLSDAFCVDRHRAAFLDLISSGGIDILFANEAEICSLFEQNDFDGAVTEAAHTLPLAVLTRSEAGSVVVSGAERHVVAAVPVEVVDTTGAGDAYAAGFMVGLTRKASLVESAALASRVAAAAIGRIGARPDATALSLLARETA